MAEMSYTEIRNRIKDISEELERLDAKAKDNGLSEEDEVYFRQLTEEFEERDKERKDIERERALARVRKSEVLKSAQAGNVEAGSPQPDDDDVRDDSVRDGKFRNPWDLSEIRTFNRTPSQIGSELRARALSAIERMPATDDRRREVATRIIERWDTKHGEIAKLLLATSHETYVRAFGKLIANQGQLAALDTDEQEAVRAAGMSTVPAEGGYLIPFQLDPNVINTADGSVNEVRQIARQVVATGNKWHGVSSAGVSSRWAGEASEAVDNSPTLAQPDVDIHRMDIFVPITIEALADAQNVAQEVGEMIAFEKDRRESVSFVSGSGDGEPFGIVTALDDTASVVDTDDNNAFAVEDVYALDGALPARYRRRASWLGGRLTYNDIRQFDTQGGSSLWVQLQADVPPLLLGRRAYESEEMDTGVETGQQILIFGDFSNYVIADRIGTTVEFIPHLVGPDRRFPTGERGWFAYARLGANSVNNGAFRMLEVDGA